MVEVSDKLATAMVTKVVQRFKNKPHLYTFENIVTVFEVMAVNSLNKADDSNEFQSQVQKNMKKLQLLHLGLSAFFMMTVDKNKPPSAVKEKCNRIMNLITEAPVEKVGRTSEQRTSAPPEREHKAPAPKPLPGFLERLKGLKAHSRAHIVQQVFAVCQQESLHLKIDYGTSSEQGGYLSQVRFHDVFNDPDLVVSSPVEERYIIFNRNLAQDDPVFKFQSLKWGNEHSCSS